MNKPLMNILYVEDNSNDSDLAKRELHKNAPNIHMEIARSLTQAYQILDPTAGASVLLDDLNGKHYDLVLTDLRLPDGSGMDLLAFIREKALPLAVVILTGTGDEEVVVSALKAGADDYVAKSSNYLTRLPLILENALQRYRALAARSARPLQVLYVEHSSMDIDLTRRHLAQHAPFIRLDTLLAGAEALKQMAVQDFASKYDVLLLDYSMPGWNTLEMLKELRQVRGLDLPVVLVTGQGNQDLALQALKLGASDYLIKSTGYLNQLPSVLDNAFHAVQMVREHKALEESEKRFRLLAEHAIDIIFRLRLSPTFGFEYVSPAVSTIIGYTPEEFYADPDLILKMIYPDDRQQLEAIIAVTIPPEQPHVLRWIRKDGSMVWTELRSRTFFDEAGQPVALEGINRDVTERMQSEERLRLLSAGIDAAANSIMLTRADGIIQWVNPAFTALTGYLADEVIGQDDRLLNTGRQADEFSRRVWQNILAGRPWHGERVSQRKDGTTFAEELTITPVINEQGETTHFISVMQDISSRKQGEEERARLFEELFRAYNATIEGWSYALDLRDRDTEGHTRRVTEMAMRLARAMGYDEEQLLQVRRGALLHDIGKMAIPDRILHKEGPLNDEEWVIMRKHPVYSFELISSIDFLRPALDIPHYHHERWDGSGYPEKLKGEGIPLTARIFAVVDVWDALRFDRPYRKAWNQEKVLEYIRSQSGIQFDPHVVEVFLELVEKIG
jgi:PAS domain S-box-containing protein/putative nucleotidyltransferase with HDIG domain